MKTIKKIKKFDCVEMKNDIQEKIYFETKSMRVEELLSYFNKQSENWSSTKYVDKLQLKNK
ncbi:MAG: hypothetical protein LBP59_00905 [Planctomycetaceae bacterium]|jgi:hypothetical protein|nr:hypothetical protein [Planctomycetaceae bacterium]